MLVSCIPPTVASLRRHRTDAADLQTLVAVDNVNQRFARHFDLSPEHAA
jgi:hypothetical protein